MSDSAYDKQKQSLSWWSLPLSFCHLLAHRKRACRCRYQYSGFDTRYVIRPCDQQVPYHLNDYTQRRISHQLYSNGTNRNALVKLSWEELEIDSNVYLYSYLILLVKDAFPQSLRLPAKWSHRTLKKTDQKPGSDQFKPQFKADLNMLSFLICTSIYK